MSILVIKKCSLWKEDFGVHFAAFLPPLKRHMHTRCNKLQKHHCLISRQNWNLYHSSETTWKLIIVFFWFTVIWVVDQGHWMWCHITQANQADTFFFLRFPFRWTGSWIHTICQLTYTVVAADICKKRNHFRIENRVSLIRPSSSLLLSPSTS